MIKLEKVITGLKCCTTHPNEYGDCMSEDCPYKSINCVDHLLQDALTLLQAQEPIEPIIDTYWETPSVYDNDVKVTENKCGACGAGIDEWDKYCRVCGRAVKWE